MSAAAGPLTEDDYRELARLVRVIHADAEAWREREAAAAGDGDHDDGA